MRFTWPTYCDISGGQGVYLAVGRTHKDVCWTMVWTINAAFVAVAVRCAKEVVNLELYRRSFPV